MSRTRTLDFRFPTYITYRDNTSTGLPVSPPYNADRVSPAGHSGGTKTMIDEVHSDYFRRIRRGEVIMGSCELSSYDRVTNPGSMGGYISAWKENLSRTGDLISEVETSAHSLLPNLGGTYSAKMRDVAVVKAYAKMKEAGIMSGEVVSDLTATVRMFKRPFDSAQTLLKRMMKSRAKRLKKSASNLARATSDTWLEYRYGWQPIILDCKTLIDRADQIVASDVVRLVARGSEKGAWNTSKTFSDLTVDPQRLSFYWPRVFSGTVTLNDEVTVSAGVVYEKCSRTVSQNAAQLFGTRVEDVNPLVWEMIPYSFVVDWFTNVGEWIQASVPDPTITVLGSWVTSKQIRVYNTTASVYCETGAGRISGNAGNSSITYDYFNRYANPSLPNTPVVTTKPLSLVHEMDAVALLCNSLLNAMKSFR